MGLHKPHDREFFTLAGATKESGGSLQLTKGQFGVVDTTKVTVNGSTLISSFAGRPKKTDFQFKMGIAPQTASSSRNTKGYSSHPFRIADVVDYWVSAPTVFEPQVDELIIGYNGIDPDSGITFEKGDVHKITVELSGDRIGMLGYDTCSVKIPIYMDADACSPCKDDCVDCDPCEGVPCAPIVLEAIKNLKNYKLLGGIPVSEVVDVIPIRGCEESPKLEKIPYKFWCLELCDTGDEAALSLVQSGLNFATPTTTTDGAVVVRKDRVGPKSTYEILVPETDGQPLDFTQTLPSLFKGCADCPEGYEEVEGGLLYAVTYEDDGDDLATTVETIPNAVAGTAVKQDAQNAGLGFYTVVLAEALSEADFTAWIEANPTATIEFVGTVADTCTSDEVTETPWTECGECTVIEECYTLDLPDNECGEERLEELQLAYPNLTIELEGTKGGCQTRYKTTVVSNLVCEECDPIFEDSYITEAPSSYEGRQWDIVLEEDSVPTGCKCGIRIKGKVVQILPDECLRDDVGAMETSVRIQASGGYMTEVRAGYCEVKTPFNVEYITRAADRTHLGFQLWDWEDRAARYFRGETRSKNNLEKLLKGQDSNLEAGKQYVNYVVVIKRADQHYSQSFSGRSDETIAYHVYAEYGRHKGVEKLLNSLATSAGLSPVVV